MKDSLTPGDALRKIVFPVAVMAVLAAATVILCGSRLYQIEDVYTNRILAGTYGSPDWRVLGLNALLAQILAGLYSFAPVLNWYGALMLLLTVCASAAAVSLCARQRSGLIPGLMIIAPVLVLSVNAVHSSVVCALCAAAGALSLMDGLSQRRTGRIVIGLLLFIAGSMINVLYASVITVIVTICMLPGSIREHRLSGTCKAFVLMAVILALLFGYSALSFSSEELSSYRENMNRYDRLQHSSMSHDAADKVNEYATMLDFYSQTTSNAAEAITEWEKGHNQWFSEHLGWSVNDVDLFFERKTVDTELIDPQAFKNVEKDVSFFNTDLGELLGSLQYTILKPQFIMLIGLFLIVAIASILTCPRSVWSALLAALFSFGGHLFMLICYRDSFFYIAPFYAAGICIMLRTFSGEGAEDWVSRRLRSKGLRVGLAAAACVIFLAGLGGLFFYEASTEVNNVYTVAIAEDIRAYAQSNPDTLFIGDNPAERYKPDTLAIPVRGQDANIMAGSYDLYSPRYTFQSETFGVTNPLKNCIESENINYISMSFDISMRKRLGEAYDAYYVIFEPVWSTDTSNSMVMKIFSFADRDTYEQYIIDHNLVITAPVEEQHTHSHEEDDHDHEAEGTNDQSADTADQAGSAQTTSNEADGTGSAGAQPTPAETNEP